MRKIVKHFTPLMLFPAIFHFAGCFTETPIAKEMAPEMLHQTDKEVIVDFIDGKSVHFDAGKYLIVKNPAKFIYGEGRYRSGDSTEYVGSVFAEPLDSGSALTGVSVSDTRMLKWYDVPDSSGRPVRFTEGGFVRVDSSKTPALAYYGRGMSFDKLHRYSGVIPLDQIQAIRTKEFSAGKTALNTAISGVAIIAAAALYYEAVIGFVGLIDEK